MSEERAEIEVANAWRATCGFSFVVGNNQWGDLTKVLAAYGAERYAAGKRAGDRELVEALRKLVNYVGRQWCSLCAKLDIAEHASYCPMTEAERLLKERAQ
jgi:hypothetical protein